jgi:hypothetical protein
MLGYRGLQKTEEMEIVAESAKPSSVRKEKGGRDKLLLGYEQGSRATTDADALPQNFRCFNFPRITVLETE